MSILPVIPLIQEYNKNRASCFDHDKIYTLTDADNKALERIASMIHLISPTYSTSLQVCKHSGQVYIRCTLPKHQDEPCMFPPIQGATKV